MLDLRRIAKKLVTPFRQYLGRLTVADRHLRGAGLEIGALQDPMPMPKGTRVRYVDIAPTEQLRAMYPAKTRRWLVDVDVVDDGEKLATVADDSQDFVASNHFFEHAEDPIGALRNMLRVVRPGGVVYMSVPDKRLTFDHARRPHAADLNTVHGFSRRGFRGDTLVARAPGQHAQRVPQLDQLARQQAEQLPVGRHIRRIIRKKHGYASGHAHHETNKPRKAKLPLEPQRGTERHGEKQKLGHAKALRREELLTAPAPCEGGSSFAPSRLRVDLQLQFFVVLRGFPLLCFCVFVAILPP